MSNAKAPAKEIERNKQTIANLLKLPENRLCAECGAKGTAAVGVAVAAGAEKPTLGVFFFRPTGASTCRSWRTCASSPPPAARVGDEG